MTLNLNKYGADMQAAWKKVRDVDGDINWALFGYEGTSFTLGSILQNSVSPQNFSDKFSS
jgi:hypothetical protein